MPLRTIATEHASIHKNREAYQKLNDETMIGHTNDDGKMDLTFQNIPKRRVSSKVNSASIVSDNQINGNTKLSNANNNTAMLNARDELNTSSNVPNLKVSAKVSFCKFSFLVNQGRITK